MIKVKLPTQLKTKLRNCPRGCTQRRTRSYWLAEKKTFDGHRCSNCGFETRQGKQKVTFTKFYVSSSRKCALRNIPHGVDDVRAGVRCDVHAQPRISGPASGLWTPFLYTTGRPWHVLWPTCCTRRVLLGNVVDLVGGSRFTWPMSSTRRSAVPPSMQGCPRASSCGESWRATTNCPRS